VRYARLTGEYWCSWVGRGPEAALDADEVLVAEVVFDEHVASTALAGFELDHLVPPFLD
jgi:hypothetical protein